MPLTIGTGRALLTAKPVTVSSNPVVVSVSSGTNNLTTGGTATINAPASIVAGNFLIAFVSCGGSGASTITAPSGWALSSNVPTGLSGAAPQVSIFTKTATGSEPSTYAFSDSFTADPLCIEILQISGSPTPSVNGTFSKYASTAAITIGTATVSIPTVLNCLPIALNTIQQLNPSNTGNPSGLTGGWTGWLLVVDIDGSNPGNTGNNNGYNATYLATGPLTTDTTTAITAGWTWGGASSTFSNTSVMIFVAP